MAPSSGRIIPLLALATCIGWPGHPAPALEPSPRSQGNLIALARLTWLLHHHHPGLAAPGVNWSARLLQFIPKTHAAQDDPALICTLNAFAAVAGHPAVDVRPIEPPDLPVPLWLRQGPEVQIIDDVLYVALSPGDCCPTAVAKIEETLQGQNLDRWVLDLRHTAGRSFGSIYSEVKVTLDWLVEGPARTPPRLSRASMDGCFDWLRAPAALSRHPARSYQEGPSMLAELPLTVVIDRTAHPAAGGWLLGLQDSGRGEMVGRPMNVQAVEPLVISLSSTLEAAVPPARYLNFDDSDRRDSRVLPDGFVMIRPELSGSELIARLDDAKRHYAAARLLPLPDGPVDGSPATPRVRRLGAVLATYCLARDLLDSNSKRLDSLDRLLRVALIEADRASTDGH